MKYLKYFEANVIPFKTPYASDPSYRRINHENLKPLKDSDTIIVYHGFYSNNDVKIALTKGLSGQEIARRVYSYESGNNPKGLFVSIDFNVVKRRFAGSGIIIEFATKIFREVYFEVINQLNQNEIISIDALVNHTNSEISTLVTSILMDDEKYTLSNWESKEIYVKAKDKNLSKLVMDAILNLRRILIELKIKE